jgi:hypothetical protein
MPGRHFARSVRICYWHRAKASMRAYGIPDRGQIAGRRLRRPTAIRSGYGRHLSPAPGQRSAGGRYAYTARPDRRARRVRQRRPGVDGQHYTHLDKGPGQVLDRFLPATAASLASAAQ